MNVFVRWVDRTSMLFGWFGAVLIAAAVLVVTQMVFVRYVLEGSTIWQTEFVTYALMASTFLASPYVLLLRGHVNVDIVANMAGRSVRFWLQLLAALLSFVFCALLAWSGWEYAHEAWAGGWTTDTVWKLPLWIPLLPLPLGIGLLCLQYVAEMIKLGKEPS